VVVPEQWPEGRSVVVAYDGSLQAARALSAFREAGIHGEREVHVVTVDPEAKSAALVAERAIDYLRLHGISARPHPAATTAAPAEAILKAVHDLGADLLVMGAYGQPVLKDFFLGSATRSLLRESQVPIFLFH
jgi:nucleotide-binding universal stress UspA family protein